MKRLLWGALALSVVGCGGSESAGGGKKDLDRAALLDPQSCKKCHADHVREWSGSMHAYAADDPVFLAMNARGQRETNGELGDFCVKCHAPMAVIEGATTDGLNLAEVPQSLKGVTCYFCHSIDSVEGTHDAPIKLASDLKMRGGIDNPVENSAHESVYSPLLDRKDPASSKGCGPCHDIVTPAGVHLERTYLEWQNSLFAKDVPGHLNCGNCHMDGIDGIVADYPGVFQRTRHQHDFPGVDTALTPWPESEAQRAAVQRELDSTVQPQICVAPFGAGVKLSVLLDNVSGGHMWPSGATQDRRAWVTLTAYDGDTVIYQSGAVADGEPVEDLVDPDLWLLRDRIYDDQGEEVHMFWEAKSYTSELLPPAVTNDKTDPAYFHALSRDYPSLPSIPTKITLSLQIRAVGLDVLDNLVASGDLDESVRDAMPTFRLAGADVEWTPDRGFNCVK